MSWKSVVKQCRFDCVGSGLFSVANMVFLLVFPVLSIVVSLVMISTHVDEHVASGLMGGLGGLASVMAYMSALGPASSEESAGHSAMRGLIPVSRTAQVVGRYLFLLVVGLLWALGSGCGDMRWHLHYLWRYSRYGVDWCLGIRCLHLRFGYHSWVGAAGLCMPVHIPQDDDGLWRGHGWLVCRHCAAGSIACRLAMAIAEYCRFPDDLVAYGACSRRVVSARIFWLHAYSHPHLPSQRTLAAHLSDRE